MNAESFFDQRTIWNIDHFLYRAKQYKPNRAIANSFKWLDLKGKSVLDVGCGQGFFSIPLAKQANHVTGIDISGQSIEYARAAARALQIDNVSFQQIDLFEFTPPQPFDVVVSITVLMHIPNTLGALQHIHSLLAPDSHLLLSEPNKQYPWFILPRWNNTQTPVFSQRFTLQQMRELLLEADFDILKESGRIFSLYPTRRTEALICLWLERWAESRLLRLLGEHISILARKA
jgi:2-polyprenyl-3-methyl-5-hydroxy-6-metoxy-1,4-benzoquinol methylase